MSDSELPELPDDILAALKREFQSRSVGDLHDDKSGESKQLAYHRIPALLRKVGISMRGGPSLADICKDLGIKTSARVSLDQLKRIAMKTRAAQSGGAPDSQAKSAPKDTNSGAAGSLGKSESTDSLHPDASEGSKGQYKFGRRWVPVRVESRTGDTLRLTREDTGAALTLSDRNKDRFQLDAGAAGGEGKADDGKKGSDGATAKRSESSGTAASLGPEPSVQEEPSSGGASKGTPKKGSKPYKLQEEVEIKRSPSSSATWQKGKVYRVHRDGSVDVKLAGSGDKVRSVPLSRVRKPGDEGAGATEKAAGGGLGLAAMLGGASAGKSSAGTKDKGGASSGSKGSKVSKGSDDALSSVLGGGKPKTDEKKSDALSSMLGGGKPKTDDKKSDALSSMLGGGTSSKASERKAESKKGGAVGRKRGGSSSGSDTDPLEDMLGGGKKSGSDGKKADSLGDLLGGKKGKQSHRDSKKSSSSSDPLGSLLGKGADLTGRDGSSSRRRRPSGESSDGGKLGDLLGPAGSRDDRRQGRPPRSSRDRDSSSGGKSGLLGDLLGGGGGDKGSDGRRRDDRDQSRDRTGALGDLLGGDSDRRGLGGRAGDLRSVLGGDRSGGFGLGRVQLDDIARGLPEGRRRDVLQLHDVLRDETGGRRRDRLAGLLGGSASDYHDDRIDELRGMFDTSSSRDRRRGSRRGSRGGDLEELLGSGGRDGYRGRGEYEGTYSDKGQEDELQIGGIALDDLEGGAVGGARRLVRRLRVVGSGATRFAGQWRGEGWARGLGRRQLERMEDAFLKHSSAMHLRSDTYADRSQSEQPVVRVRVLPLARLGSALQELQVRPSVSALALWRRQSGLHEEDVLALGEFVRSVVDLQRSTQVDGSTAGIAGTATARRVLGLALGGKGEQERLDDNDVDDGAMISRSGPLGTPLRGSREHKGSDVADESTRRSEPRGLSSLLGTSEEVAPKGMPVFRPSLPGIRVLCGDLLLKESCASCGGVGVLRDGKSLDIAEGGLEAANSEVSRCPSCSGSGLQGTSCAHTLRRLSAGRPAAQQARIAAMACAFASASIRSAESRHSSSSLQAAAARASGGDLRGIAGSLPQEFGALPVSAWRKALQAAGRQPARRDEDAAARLLQYARGSSEESGPIAFLEFLSCFHHVVEEVSQTLSPEQAAAQLRMDNAPADARGALRTVCEMLDRVISGPRDDSRAWRYVGSDGMLGHAVLRLHGGEQLLASAGFVPIDSTHREGDPITLYVLEGGHDSTGAPVQELPESALGAAVATRVAFEAQLEIAEGCPRLGAAVRLAMQAKGRVAAALSCRLVLRYVSNVLSNPRDARAWRVPCRNPVFQDKIAVLGGLPARRLMESCCFVPGGGDLESSLQPPKQESSGQRSDSGKRSKRGAARSSRVGSRAHSRRGSRDGSGQQAGLIPWEALPKHFTIRGGSSHFEEQDRDESERGGPRDSFRFPELPESSVQLLLLRRADLERAIGELEADVARHGDALEPGSVTDDVAGRGSVDRQRGQRSSGRRGKSGSRASSPGKRHVGRDSSRGRRGRGSAEQQGSDQKVSGTSEAARIGMVLSAIQGDHTSGISDKRERAQSGRGRSRGRADGSSRRGGSGRATQGGTSGHRAHGGHRSGSSFPSQAIVRSQAACISRQFSQWDRRNRGAVSLEDAAWSFARRLRVPAEEAGSMGERFIAALDVDADGEVSTQDFALSLRHTFVPPAPGSVDADGSSPTVLAAAVLHEAGGPTLGAGCSVPAALGLVRLCSGPRLAKQVSLELAAFLRWVTADDHDPSRWTVLVIRDERKFKLSAPESAQLESGPSRVIDWGRRPVLLLAGSLIRCSCSAAVLRAIGLVPQQDEGEDYAGAGAGAGESKEDDGGMAGERFSAPDGAIRLRFLPGESEAWTSLPPSVRSVAQNVLDRLRHEAQVSDIECIPDCAAVAGGVLASVQGASRAARAQLRSSAVASLRQDAPDESAWYQWHRCVSMATKVLAKVVEDPDESKWRRVNADSRAFVDAMGRLPSFSGDRISGLSFLRACGWEPTSDGKLVLPSSATLDTVKMQLVQLQCCLELAGLYVGETAGVVAQEQGDGARDRQTHRHPRFDEGPETSSPDGQSLQRRRPVDDAMGAPLNRSTSPLRVSRHHGTDSTEPVRPSQAQTAVAVQAAKAAQHLAEERAARAEKRLESLRLQQQVAPELRASAIVDALRKASTDRDADSIHRDGAGASARGRSSGHDDSHKRKKDTSRQHKKHETGDAFSHDWKPPGRLSEGVPLLTPASSGGRTLRLAGNIVPVVRQEDDGRGTARGGKKRKGRGSSSRGRAQSRSRSRGASSSRKGKKKGHRSGGAADAELLEGLEGLGLGPVPAIMEHDPSQLEITTGCTVMVGTSESDCELCMVVGVEGTAEGAADARLVLAAPLSRDHGISTAQVFVMQGDTHDTLELLRKDVVSFVRNEIVGLAIEQAAAVAAREASRSAEKDAFERYSTVTKRQQVAIAVSSDRGECETREGLVVAPPSAATGGVSLPAAAGSSLLVGSSFFPGAVGVSSSVVSVFHRLEAAFDFINFEAKESLALKEAISRLQHHTPSVLASDQVLPGYAFVDEFSHGSVLAPTIAFTWKRLVQTADSLLDGPSGGGKGAAAVDGTANVRLMEAPLSAEEFASLFRASMPMDQSEMLPRIPFLDAIMHQAEASGSTADADEGSPADDDATGPDVWHAARELAAEWSTRHFRATVAVFGNQLAEQRDECGRTAPRASLFPHRVSALMRSLDGFSPLPSEIPEFQSEFDLDGTFNLVQVVQFRIWRDSLHKRAASGTTFDELPEEVILQANDTDRMLRAGIRLGMPRLMWARDAVAAAATEALSAKGREDSIDALAVEDLERSLPGSSQELLDCTFGGVQSTPLRERLVALGGMARFSRGRALKMFRPLVPDSAPAEALGGTTLGSSIAVSDVLLTSVSANGSRCCTLHSDGTAVVWDCLTGTPVASWRAIEPSDPAEAISRAVHAPLQLKLSSGLVAGRFQFAFFPQDRDRPMHDLGFGLGALEEVPSLVCPTIRTGAVTVQHLDGDSEQINDTFDGPADTGKVCVVACSFGRAIQVRSSRAVDGGALLRTIDPPQWQSASGLGEGEELKQLAPVLYMDACGLVLCEAVNPESMDAGESIEDQGAEERDIVVVSTHFGTTAARFPSAAFACHSDQASAQLLAWIPNQWRPRTSGQSGHPLVAGHVAVVHSREIGIYSLSVAAQHAFDSAGRNGMDGPAPVLQQVAGVQWADALQPRPGLQLPSCISAESFVARSIKYLPCSGSLAVSQHNGPAILAIDANARPTRRSLASGDQGLGGIVQLAVSTAVEGKVFGDSRTDSQEVSLSVGGSVALQAPSCAVQIENGQCRAAAEISRRASSTSEAAPEEAALRTSCIWCFDSGDTVCLPVSRFSSALVSLSSHRQSDLMSCLSGIKGAENIASGLGTVLRNRSSICRVLFVGVVGPAGSASRCWKEACSEYRRTPSSGAGSTALDAIPQLGLAPTKHILSAIRSSRLELAKASTGVGWGGALSGAPDGSEVTAASGDVQLAAFYRDGDSAEATLTPVPSQTTAILDSIAILSPELTDDPCTPATSGPAAEISGFVRSVLEDHVIVAAEHCDLVLKCKVARECPRALQLLKMADRVVVSVPWEQMLRLPQLDQFKLDTPPIAGKTPIASADLVYVKYGAKGQGGHASQVLAIGTVESQVQRAAIEADVPSDLLQQIKSVFCSAISSGLLQSVAAICQSRQIANKAALLRAQGAILDWNAIIAATASGAGGESVEQSELDVGACSRVATGLAELAATAQKDGIGGYSTHDFCVQVASTLWQVSSSVRARGASDGLPTGHRSAVQLMQAAYRLLVASPIHRSMIASIAGVMRDQASPASVAIAEAALQELNQQEYSASGFVAAVAAVLEPVVSTIASSHGLDKSVPSAVSSIARLGINSESLVKSLRAAAFKASYPAIVPADPRKHDSPFHAVASMSCVAPALLAGIGGGVLLSPQLLSDAVRRLGDAGQVLSADAELLRAGCTGKAATALGWRLDSQRSVGDTAGLDGDAFCAAVRASHVGSQVLGLADALGGGVPSPLSLIVPPSMQQLARAIGAGSNGAGGLLLVNRASALYQKVCSDVAREVSIISMASDAPRGLLLHLVGEAGADSLAKVRQASSRLHETGQVSSRASSRASGMSAPPDDFPSKACSLSAVLDALSSRLGQLIAGDAAEAENALGMMAHCRSVLITSCDSIREASNTLIVAASREQTDGAAIAVRPPGQPYKQALLELVTAAAHAAIRMESAGFYMRDNSSMYRASGDDDDDGAAIARVLLALRGGRTGADPAQVVGTALLDSMSVLMKASSAQTTDKSTFEEAVLSIMIPYATACAKFAVGHDESDRLKPSGGCRRAATAMMDAVFGEDGHAISSEIRRVVAATTDNERLESTLQETIIAPRSLEATLAGTSDRDSGVAGASLSASAARSISSFTMAVQRAATGSSSCKSQLKSKSSRPSLTSRGQGKLQELRATSSNYGLLRGPYVAATRNYMRLQDELVSDRPATRASALQILASKVTAITAPADPQAAEQLCDSSDALVDSGILQTALRHTADPDPLCREACAAVLLALSRCMDADKSARTDASLALPHRRDELGDGFMGGVSATAGLAEHLHSTEMMSSEAVLLGAVRCVVDELEMQAAPHDRPEKRCAMACLHFLLSSLRSGAVSAQQCEGAAVLPSIAVSAHRSWKSGARPRSISLVPLDTSALGTLDAFAVTGTAMGLLNEATLGRLGPDIGMLCEKSSPIQAVLRTIRRVFGTEGGATAGSSSGQYTIQAATEALQGAVQGAVADGTDSILAVRLSETTSDDHAGSAPTSGATIMQAHGMDLSGDEARGVVESLDPVASALSVAAPFLQSCLADAEQQASAAYHLVQQTSPGVSSVQTLAESLLLVARSQGLRQARSRRARSLQEQTSLEEHEPDPRLFALASDSALSELSDLCWQAAAMLWAGVVNVSSRSRLGREAQMRWIQTLQEMLGVVGGAASLIEAGTAHPRGLAIALGLGLEYHESYGLGVLAEVSTAGLTASDLAGVGAASLQVVKGASAVLARLLYCTAVLPGDSGFHRQAIGPDLAATLLAGTNQKSAVALSRSWTATPMHWRGRLQAALSNCNLGHALALGSAHCRRTTRSVVRASTHIRALVDGLPQWLAARGSVTDALLSVGLAGLLRDMVLGDSPSPATMRVIGDILHTSDLLAHALSVGLSDDTRVDPGQTAPTAMFENLVGDRAVFRAEAAAILWRVVAVHRAVAHMADFAASFGSMKPASEELHRMCAQCEDVIKASGTLTKEASTLATSRQPWEQACVQANLRSVLAVGSPTMTQGVSEAGVPASLLHAPASLLVPTRGLREDATDGTDPDVSARIRQDRAWGRWLRANLHGPSGQDPSSLLSTQQMRPTAAAGSSNETGDVAAMRRSLQAAGLRAAVGASSVQSKGNSIGDVAVAESQSTRTVEPLEAEAAVASANADSAQAKPELRPGGSAFLSGPPARGDATLWLTVDAPGVSEVDHEAILDVVLSVVSDQSKRQPGSLLPVPDPVTLAAVAFVRSGLRGLFSAATASMRAGRRGIAEDTPAVLRESRGCVVLEMRASEAVAALLVRRCRSGALERAARAAERSRGMAYRGAGRGLDFYDDDDDGGRDRGEFLRGSKDPDAGKVDPRLSFTVGDSTVKTMLDGGISPGRALGSAAGQEQGADVVVQGCRILRLVGDGFDPVELYRGGGMDGARPDEGWAGATAARRSVHWGTMRRSRGANGGMGDAALRAGTQQTSGIVSPEEGSEAEPGPSSDSSIASIVSSFGAGIIDIKDAFDALGSVVPSTPGADRGRSSSKQEEPSETEPTRVLELVAIPRCLSKIGLGVAAGPADKYLREQRLIRKWMVQRVSPAGNARSTASLAVSFDGFVRLVDASLRRLSAGSGIPVHVAGLAWVQEWQQNALGRSAATTAARPAEPPAAPLGQRGSSRRAAIPSGQAPASPTKQAVVRVYQTFATHTSNGVGVDSAAFPQACRALGLQCSSAVAARVFRDFGMTDESGLTEELFRAAIRRLRRDAGLRSMLQSSGLGHDDFGEDDRRQFEPTQELSALLGGRSRDEQHRNIGRDVRQSRSRHDERADVPWDRASNHGRDRRLVELLGPDSAAKSRFGRRTEGLSRPGSRSSLRDLLGDDGPVREKRSGRRGESREGALADLLGVDPSEGLSDSHRDRSSVLRVDDMAVSPSRRTQISEISGDTRTGSDAVRGTRVPPRHDEREPSGNDALASLLGAEGVGEGSRRSSASLPRTSSRGSGSRFGAGTSRQSSGVGGAADLGTGLGGDGLDELGDLLSGAGRRGGRPPVGSRGYVSRYGRSAQPPLTRDERRRQRAEAVEARRRG